MNTQMERVDQELLSPEAFLKLSSAERQNIRGIQYAVASFEDSSPNSDFVRIAVKWNTPTYRMPRFS